MTEFNTEKIILKATTQFHVEGVWFKYCSLNTLEARQRRTVRGAWLKERQEGMSPPSPFLDITKQTALGGQCRKRITTSKFIKVTLTSKRIQKNLALRAKVCRKELAKEYKRGPFSHQCLTKGICQWRKKFGLTTRSSSNNLCGKNDDKSKGLINNWIPFPEHTPGHNYGRYYSV